jgi:hypothetical protein
MLTKIAAKIGIEDYFLYVDRADIKKIMQLLVPFSALSGINELPYAE